MDNLDEWIGRQKKIDFKWAKFDCLTFTLGYFDRYHDKEFISKLPDYHSHFSGLRALAGMGMTFSEFLDGLVTEQGMVATWSPAREQLVLCNDMRICHDGPMTGLRLDENHVAYRQESGILIMSIPHDIFIEWKVKEQDIG